jgi:hypothetical protein
MLKINFKVLQLRNLSALAITETELKLIASAAIIGESKDRKGYKTPAANSEYMYKKEAKNSFD